MTRDFDHYRNVYESRPFEPTLESFRHRRVGKTLTPFFVDKAPDVLDVGIGRHAVSRSLPFATKSLTLVEPMKWSVEADAAEYSNDGTIRFHGVLDEFLLHQRGSTPGQIFDLVILSEVLHEMTINEARRAVIGVTELLRPDGLVVAVVPNRDSVHRILGVHMGKQASLEAKTDAETSLHQLSGFTKDRLTQLVTTHGLTEVFCETFFLKPSSHSEMQKFAETINNPEDCFEALYEMSNLLPDHGAEILGIYKAGPE